MAEDLSAIALDYHRQPVAGKIAASLAIAAGRHLILELARDGR